MQQWFNNLPRKEQIMLLVAAGAILAYLIFFVILGSLSDSVSDLKRQNQAAEKTLAEVKSLATEYQRLQSDSSSSQSTDGNLTSIVDSTVKQYQLSMSRFQPSSRGDVQVRFESAPFNSVIGWLHELEGKRSIAIKDLTISPTSGSGLVNVSVRLYKS